MGSLAQTNRPLKKWRMLILLLGICLVAGAALWWMVRPIDPVTQLQQRSRNLPTLALANSNLAPPTNKWFSSLAFKQPSDPVFAYPLAVQTTPTGFGVSQPTVRTNADGIDALFTQDAAFNFGPDTKSYIRDYDDLSVTLELRQSTRTIGTWRITQGSPYIFMQLQKGATVTVEGSQISQAGTLLTLQQNGRTYELQLGTQAAFAAATRTITANADAEIALYAVPAQANVAALRQAAGHPITRTEVTYRITHNTAETTFTIHTKDGQPTVFGLLPGQQSQSAHAGTFATLLGTQTWQQGTQFTFSTPLATLPADLPVEQLPDDKKAILVSMVQHDAATLAFTATDTYYAGKQLYRAAQLLQLAHQLGLQTEANTIANALKTEFAQWLDPNTGNQRHDKFFYYDSIIKGIVGEKPSFGSQDFNDHHFHYGYFLHAAAIVARQDAVFAADYKDRITMLVRDIANPSRTDAHLPYVRSFDQYAGHSWASGFAPFGAGNNQESSSEAVNAWHGMYLWAQVVHDDQMRDIARWLYARESQAALAYYLNIDLARPELAGYGHTIVSLLWSGKADYATFFDAAPESKLAIQLIPMGPASTYLQADRARILQNIAQLNRETGQAPSKFKDYIVMYKALADPQGALADATTIGDADIDGANSRSYLYAWLYTR